MNCPSDWRRLVSSFGYGFVDDIEQYKHIVKVWAYNDMQPRTIGKLGDFRKDANNDAKLNCLFDRLAEELYAFVVKGPVRNEDAFDEWHKKTCEWFLNEFNKITDGKGVEKIAFGKAQKIINVSFKYIYCLKEADKYIDKFEHCHMILDRYTYSEGFYKQEVIPWNNKDEKRAPLTLNSLTRWSNLTVKEYDTIQKNVRDFIKETTEYVDANGLPLTPFEAEFYIFSKYKVNIKKKI